MRKLGPEQAWMTRAFNLECRGLEMGVPDGPSYEGPASKLARPIMDTCADSMGSSRRWGAFDAERLCRKAVIECARGTCPGH